MAINSFYLQIIIGVAHPRGRRLRPVAGPAVPRRMSVAENAGRLADPADLVDVDALIGAYFDEQPDPAQAGQRVAFGTSGHRGTSTARTFNEAHVLAIAEAVCRYRAEQGIDGPLFLGRDTHALSEPAAQTHRRGALRPRRRGHGRRRRRLHADARDLARDPHPQPRRRPRHGADGIVVTPSHNPPQDGGVKYNPPHGGPADTDVTGWIQREANALLEGGLRDVKRTQDRRARCAATTTSRPTSTTCPPSSTSTAIRDSGLRLGVDPLGGASVRLLGGDRRAPRPRPDDHQRPGRPDLPLRAARLGRQDPDGLLVALRDGQAARSAPTSSTSPSPTTPTPTATGSSRRARAC